MRRMMTGSPAISLRIPMKSSRCIRPIQPDPLSPELACAGLVSRIVGVCPDLETPDLVRPRQEILKLDFAVEIRLDCPDRAREDLSRAPIDRDALAPSDHFVADPELRRVVVDLDLLAARDARDPDTSGDDRRMARRPPSGRANPFGIQCAMHVVRRGLDPNQDHGL